MTKNSFLIALLTLLSCCIIVGCDRHPSGVLGKEDMARLMADIHRAEVVTETNTRTYNDSMRRVLRQSIYAAHGVTSEQVDSSLSWYGYNMERYMEVYDRVIEILENDLTKAREQSAVANESSDIHMTFEGDSVDVWTGERFRRWNRRQPADIIKFYIVPDNNSMNGDAYTLRSKLIGAMGPAEVTMVAEYADNRYDYLSVQFNGDGWHDARLPLDSEKMLKAVYGTITYRPQGTANAYIDSISLVRTRAGSNLDEEARRRLKRFATQRANPTYVYQP